MLLLIFFHNVSSIVFKARFCLEGNYQHHDKAIMLYQSMHRIIMTIIQHSKSRIAPSAHFEEKSKHSVRISGNNDFSTSKVGLYLKYLCPHQALSGARVFMIIGVETRNKIHIFYWSKAVLKRQIVYLAPIHRNGLREIL